MLMLMFLTVSGDKPPRQKTPDQKIHQTKTLQTSI